MKLSLLILVMLVSNLFSKYVNSGEENKIENLIAYTTYNFTVPKTDEDTGKIKIILPSSITKDDLDLTYLLHRFGGLDSDIVQKNSLSVSQKKGSVTTLEAKCDVTGPLVFFFTVSVKPKKNINYMKITITIKNQSYFNLKLFCVYIPLAVCTIFIILMCVYTCRRKKRGVNPANTQTYTPIQPQPNQIYVPTQQNLYMQPPNQPQVQYIPPQQPNNLQYIPTTG